MLSLPLSRSDPPGWHQAHEPSPGRVAGVITHSGNRSTSTVEHRHNLCALAVYDALICIPKLSQRIRRARLAPNAPHRFGGIPEFVLRRADSFRPRVKQSDPRRHFVYCDRSIIETSFNFPGKWAVIESTQQLQSPLPKRQALWLPRERLPELSESLETQPSERSLLIKIHALDVNWPPKRCPSAFAAHRHIRSRNGG